MEPIATKSDILCSINLNMAFFSSTGNVQQVFNLDPCVMKHLWCDIVDSTINSFLYDRQITYWCPVDLVLNKPPQKKILGGIRSGDLAGHVMYGDPLPIHVAGNCSFKHV